MALGLDLLLTLISFVYLGKLITSGSSEQLPYSSVRGVKRSLLNQNIACPR